MSLRPCSSCGRHVRNTETRCPFCATALDAVAERPAIALPRAGRAAIMAFGAITSAGAAGCSFTAAYGAPSIDTGPGAVDAAPAADAATMGGTDAAYGGPPMDAAMSEDDSGGGMNLYGGPPMDDAATDQDAGGGVPLYGGAGF